MRSPLFAISFAVLLPLIVSGAEPTQRGPIGKLVVTNVEGSATIGSVDTTQDMQERGVYNAAGTVIETKPNDDPNATDEGFVTVVLSNGIALYLEPGTRIEIREFSQENFNPTRTDMDVEPSVSNTRIFVTRGTVAISTSEMLPGSNIVLQTPQGEVNVRGRQVVVQTTATSTRIAMFDGAGTVQPGSLGGTSTISRALQAGQEIVLQSATAGQPGNVTVTNIPQNQQTPFSDRVAMASIARRTVFFETVASPVATVGATPSGSGGAAQNQEESSQGQTTGNAQGSAFVSAFTEPTQQIVPVIVVPVNLPVQFTVSPSRLR